MWHFILEITYFWWIWKFIFFLNICRLYIMALSARKTYLILCFAQETWYASVLIFQCGTGWVSMLGLIGTHTHKAYNGEYSEKFTYFGMIYYSIRNLQIWNFYRSGELDVCFVFSVLFLFVMQWCTLFLHIWGKKDNEIPYFILNFCCPSVTLIADCNIWLQVDAKLQEDLTKLDDLLGPPMSIPLIGWSYKQMVYLQIKLWKIYAFCHNYGTYTWH